MTALDTMIEEVYQRLKADAVLRDFADALIKTVRPAIGVRYSDNPDNESKALIGTSRYGGHPDLPPTIEYPRTPYGPMHFMGQIRLEDAAPADLAGLLPKTGLFSFFIPQMWGNYKGKMFYFEDVSRLTRVITPDNLTPIKPEKAVDFIPYVSFPEPNSTLVKQILGLTPGMTVEETRRKFRPYLNWHRDAHRGAWEHGLLGYLSSTMFSESIDDTLTRQTVKAEDNIASHDPQDYVRLFQTHLLGVDNNRTGYRYDDWTFFFIIHRDDLAKRKFDNVIFDTDSGE